MTIWQSDFWHYSSTSAGEKRWLLLICECKSSRETFSVESQQNQDRRDRLIYQAECSQAEASSEWLTEQLKQAIQAKIPEKIQIFRPQIVGLFTLATENLNLTLEVTRRTPEIKAQIRQYQSENSAVISSKNYLALDRPPPQNLPENIWGEDWNFASISASEIIDFTKSRPIPFCDLPESLLSLNKQLSPLTKVPGIAINGGKKSLILARWLVETKPVALNYIATEIGHSGGLVLESGLVDRWIMATFESSAVAQAAKDYEEAKQASLGIHFLLIQPDDSGMTYTGFWLLKDD